MGSLWLSQRLWPLSSRYRAMPARARLEWDGRLPSTLHALAITLAGVYLFVFSPTFAEDHVRAWPAAAPFARALLQSKRICRQGLPSPARCSPSAHAAAACLQAGDSPFMLRTSPLTDAALGFSLGYFATDMMLLVLYFPSFGGPEMALHHLAALASVAAAAFQARARPLLLPPLLLLLRLRHSPHQLCSSLASGDAGTSTAG